MAPAKGSAAKKSAPKQKAKSTLGVKELTRAEIIRLARSPSDSDQVAVARALDKQLTKKEALAFKYGVIRGTSSDNVRLKMGLKNTDEAEALIASASKKLG